MGLFRFKLVSRLNSFVMMACLAFALVGCKASIRSPTVANLLLPLIDSIVPPTGPVGGGTLIVISGQNFTSSTTVTIGGVPCTSLDLVSSTILNCVTPSHSAGKATVVVSNGSLPEIASLVFDYVTPISSIPGFEITIGGGISTATGVMAHAAIGEVPVATPQSAVGISVHSGIISIIH